MSTGCLSGCPFVGAVDCAKSSVRRLFAASYVDCTVGAACRLRVPALELREIAAGAFRETREEILDVAAVPS